MPDDIQKKVFSKNLLNLLEEREKSQKEVADAIGVSPQTFNTWCQGVAIPRMGKVQLLADYFHIKKSDLIESKTPASDPLRAYYDRLETFLQESPEHRALVDDAVHVRAEDIELARQLLSRFADPDSAAPELPEIENVNKSLRTANNSCERANNGADEIELTAETLKRVTNSPEVLAEDAAYIKSRRNAEKKALSSSRITSGGRKSG